MKFSYIEAIKDLNKDIEELYNTNPVGINPIQNSYCYTYETQGFSVIIKFKGIEIFNSKNYQIENGKSLKEMSMTDFEDYLEEKVIEIGNLFLTYGFEKHEDSYNYDNDYRYDGQYRYVDEYYDEEDEEDEINYLPSS